MELDLQLFGGRGGSSGVATAGGGSSMQDTYGQMAEAKTEQGSQPKTEAPKTEAPKKLSPEEARQIADQKRKDYAESIRQSQDGEGAYFNSDGDLVHRESDGSQGLKKARQNNPTGLHYVVNHSDGSSFNAGDVEEFGEFKHRSMTVVTPSTEKSPNGRTYTLTRTPKASPENVEKFSAGASKAYMDQYQSSINAGATAAGARQWANFAIRKWMKSNAGRYGIQYTEE